MNIIMNKAKKYILKKIKFLCFLFLFIFFLLGYSLTFFGTANSRVVDHVTLCKL